MPCVPTDAVHNSRMFFKQQGEMMSPGEALRSHERGPCQAPRFSAAFPASVATFQNATAEACKAMPEQAAVWQCESILIRPITIAAKWYLDTQDGLNSPGDALYSHESGPYQASCFSAGFPASVAKRQNATAAACKAMPKQEAAWQCENILIRPITANGI